MQLNLDGHVAVVAGSSRGIGKAIARAFLDEGCRVVITGQNEEQLLATRDEFTGSHGEDRILAWSGDFRQSSVIREALDCILGRWGRLDSVVANIGKGGGRSGWELSAPEWEASFDANLWGSVALATEALPHLIRARRGSLLFIASIAGLEALPAPLPYGMAKAALLHFVKTLSRSVGKHQVRVNGIAPGNILFPGGSWERHLAERPDETEDYIQTEVPLGRFGRPEDVADLAVFLSSERASFISGACLVVDGGQTRSI